MNENEPKSEYPNDQDQEAGDKDTYKYWPYTYVFSNEFIDRCGIGYYETLRLLAELHRPILRIPQPWNPPLAKRKKRKC